MSSYFQACFYVIGEDIKATIKEKTDYTVYYVEDSLYGIGSISAAIDVLLPTLTKPGYKIEWYLDPNNDNTKVTCVTATNHLTLYGKWVANN